MSHLANLEKVLGSLKDKTILDVGAGRGGFLIECAKEGYQAVGLELNSEKIKHAQENASSQSLEINLQQGIAEELPFSDKSFDFINVSEVVEHVENPNQVLKEIYRVLKFGGHAYVSVHNRFGLYDTHFHVYFLGWVPRFLAEPYLKLVGKHKEYSKMPDKQKITEMHYFTFQSFKKLSATLGFTVKDIRELKIRKWKGIRGVVAPGVYSISRLWYFSTFHFLLYKETSNEHPIKH